MNELTFSAKDFLLLSDVNLDLLKDKTFSDQLFTNYSLQQLITQPTRVAKSSEILIDHNI